MKTSRIAWLCLAAIGYLLVMCLVACTRRPQETTPPPVACTPEAPGLFPSKQQVPDSHLRDSPAPVPSHTKPGLLSGIGGLFSTPEGRANRQAVRLAKATAPRIGKKAQATLITGNDNKVSQASAGKIKAAAVLASDSAIIADTHGGAAAIGTGARAEGGATVVKPGFWGAVASAFNWWWLLLPLAYAVYRFRKFIPFIG